MTRAPNPPKPLLRTTAAALAAAVLAVLVASSSPADAGVIYTVIYLDQPFWSGISGSPECGPPIASTSPLPGRISLTVGVRPGPCPSFYAASQATAQCTTLMQGGYPTRTWCRPGNTMSITSDGFYGWIDSGPVPDALKQNGFNYELWFSNTTQTCDLPPRNGLSVVAASMLLNNATRPVPAGCRTPLLNGRMCRQSPFGPTGQALSIILGPAARSYVESCGRMGTSPLRVQSGNKKTTARKKTTSARKKTTTRKKVVTTKRRS